MRFLVRRRQTAAASSGNSIFLLGVLVGCWSLDTRLLLVLMAGGAAWTALAAVLERVLDDGGSEGIGEGLDRAALRRRCAFTWLLVISLAKRTA